MKTKILIILLLSSLFSFGQIPVMGDIIPANPADTYPMVKSQYVKGGLKQVDHYLDLFNIPTQRLTIGMIASIADSSYKLYQLKSISPLMIWEELITGSAGNPILSDVTVEDTTRWGMSSSGGGNPVLVNVTPEDTTRWATDTSMPDAPSNDTVFGRMNGDWIEASPLVHTHTESDITNLDKYTQAEVDNLLSGKADNGHNHNTEYYQKSEFLEISSGVNDGGKPIVLNAQGQVDPSMLDVSVFYYVGPFTPTAGMEYPDTSGESYGAFWVTQGVSGDYTFTGGDLTGKTISNGDFMVWSAAGWSIMAGEMNPILYYRLDGSQALTADFAGGGHKITNVTDGIQVTDGATVGQASAMVEDLRNEVESADQNLQIQIDNKSDKDHKHIEADITDLDKYTKPEVDNKVNAKADTIHTHIEADITDLDKYTQAEVDSRLNSKEDTLGSPNSDGQILSSSIDGTRSWIDPPTNTTLEWGNITGVISNQTDLQDSLNAKAYVVHSHTESDITDLDKYTQTEVNDLLGAKSDTSHNHDFEYAPIIHTHIESEITNLDKYTQAEVDNLLSGKADNGHNHDGEYYQKTEFLDVSSGINDAGLPIILNSQGQIDPSMLDVSTFYYVGSFTPTSGTEYPDPSSETHGAFWV